MANNIARLAAFCLGLSGCSPHVSVLYQRVLTLHGGYAHKVAPDFFDADDAAGYGRLVNALDGAKPAGATTLGFVMPEAKSGK